MRNKILSGLLTFAAVLMIYNCTRNISGVETTNGNGFTVSAVADTIEGIAPPFSQVFLFDTAYIPYIDSGIGIATSTDRNGRFRIGIGQRGCYHVFVVGPDAQLTGLSSETIIEEKRTSSSVKSHSMSRPGSVSGSINTSTGGPLLVYLAGMCHYELISDRRDFHFITVAPGIYKLRVARLGDEVSGKFTIMYERVVSVESNKMSVIGDIDIKE